MIRLAMAAAFVFLGVSSESTVWGSIFMLLAAGLIVDVCLRRKGA